LTSTSTLSALQGRWKPETAVHLKLARISVVLARLSAASEEHIGTDMEACYGRAAERIRELLQHHDTPRLGSAILGRRKELP
jgi:hypothetical protein